MGDNMSPADLKAVLGNGTTTVAYPMGNFGNGFGNGDWSWILLLILLSGGYGFGGGFGGFGGFGMGMDFMYPWLANGQQEIMTNTNNGFDNLHLSNQIEGTRDAIHGISNQICNSTADITGAVTNGFYNSEISANNRQMANMNQNFDNQIATLNGFYGLNNSLKDCCCENRLGVQDLKATVISENCNDREVLRQIGQDILVNQTANTQKIIDEIFRDRLDEKDSKIQELNRQIQSAELRASQIAQTQAITSNIYNELKNCPVGTIPVFGNQPIFSCTSNLANSGCGCNNGYNTLI